MSTGLASIILVGLSANYPIPGVYFELDFAQGPVAGSSSPRTAIIMGNKTSAGTATPDTVVYGAATQTPVQTEADVISLFGTGSQIHRAYLRFTALNPTTALFFIAVTESGGANATATQTIATTATSNGNCRVWCGQDFVDTAISLGDTATIIAGNIVLAVNSQTRWPVTASSSAGAITYTARNAGPEGNWIRMQALITPATATIATTTTLTTNTFLSGGTTADSNVAALATIKNTRYYTIVVCDSDATNIGRVVTQVNSDAQPTVGIRQRVFAGSMDTISNTITVTTGLNAARAEVIWGNACDMQPLELAANNAAIYSLLESGASVGVNRKNFSGFPSSAPDASLWQVLPGRNGIGGGPTTAQLVSALTNGVTPIAISTAGAAYLVKRVTTHCLNGSVPDFRVRDPHKVSVCDYWGDDAVALTQLQFGGKDLLPDPAQGQPPPPGIAVTPSIWGGALKGLVSLYGNAGQFQNVANILATAIIQKEVSPPNRLSGLFQLTVVDIADQFSLLALQTG